jgi:hypothetical protein
VSLPISESNDLPPYALVLSLEYQPEDAGRVRRVGRELAAARAGRPPGYRFAAYTESVGSKQKIHVLAPLQSPQQTEEGNDFLAGSLVQETLDALSENLKGNESFIATYAPDLSNPADEHEAGPFPYVYLISAVMKPGLADEIKSRAREAGRKIVAAHRQHARGRNFITYHSYDGPDDVFYVAVPFNRFSELDGWIDNQELLQEVYGEAEAAGLLSGIGQVTAKSASRIAKYHPFLSNTA